ncbi:hypothetical protein SAY87_016552 [Trapa incisa]|uniref:histone acetyltransferase n=1 Tax=Trapa incisa TaxID=236973 RepID=A0AAN7L706_9MYRT|nr:hypothetical protein SAY87_016552 [Trapa incisa]
MNVHARVSGQVPGLVPDQTMAQLPPGGNSSMYPIQNLGPAVGSTGMTNMDQDLSARNFMLKKIFLFLRKRHQQQTINDVQKRKFYDIAKRLEECLFKSAHSKEDYMNMGTLESRLIGLIRRSMHSNRPPPSSSVMGAMIPTPGIPHNENSNSIVTSSLHATANTMNNVHTTSVTSSNILPNGGLPNQTLNRADGALSNGYQQVPSQFSMASGGHIPHLSAQKMSSQMIPTPGFNNNSNNQSFLNDESSNKSGRFSTAESATTMSSYGKDQKMNIGGQNSGHMFHSEKNDAIHYGVQQSSYTFKNGAPGAYHPVVGNNTQLADGVDISDQNIAYDSSPKVSQHHFDQYQWPSLQGDGYACNSYTLMNSHSLSKSNTMHSNLTSTHQDSASTEGYASSFSSQGAAAICLVNSSCKLVALESERNFLNQQRWLLFLRHARRCTAPQGRCPSAHCDVAQKLLRHMESCSLPDCPFPRCRPTKVLINHHRFCVDQHCPVCIPVKTYLQGQLKSRLVQNSTSTPPSSVVGSFKASLTGDNLTMVNQKKRESSEDKVPSQKRMKVDVQLKSLKVEDGNSAEFISVLEHTAPQADLDQAQHTMPLKEKMKMGTSASSEYKSPQYGEPKSEDIENISNPRLDVKPTRDTTKQNTNQLDKEDQVKLENSDQPDEPAAVTKSGKPKVKGVSLIELFTPEQVREHIKGLRQWVGQSKAKAEKNQAMEHLMSENSCQLCAVEKLTFEPPPIYCMPCGSRIKRNAMYYTVGAGDTRHYFCIPCYNEARGDTIVADGITIPKAKLEKKKNDEETEEWWVQCDKCEAWQHQICALFNGRRNDGGQAEYTCPNCYIDEVERRERIPLPQSAVLGAKDLPKTVLSDHIEQRLVGRLKQERQERAKIQGKGYDEVPGAEALVVRVVSSVDKKLEVKQNFLENFQEENYPTEFPYKSKVILLFQKIEGVEVCLFGMYVQEFGSECQFPNQRRVYLSYLDSVKYFRPEVKTVTGEALRTFVYHEILIGYLEYCKLRGFTSCYIWACPPLKGEDYILYCHPEIQKTPRSDKLREWYLSMLRKATKENIVVDLTNLYDHFFTRIGECKAKITAARLPYFDGDYWPGAAEEFLCQIRQEEENKKQNKKGTMKKTITKRALKASGQSDLSGNASKDLLLMHKLRETITPMKEDFIMVHLQHACSHCCILMVSGNRWACNQCKNFQICDKCYDEEQKREEGERHTVNHKEKHTLYPIQITNVPDDTKDKDEILESEFFDTRQSFLSLCQGNHYQYDTLRRAKHSSMMILYHLHNPTAPAYVTTCNVCYVDIEAGQGWRCEVCSDYDVCNNCYQNGINHPHKLTNHPSIAECDAQNKEARQLRVVQLRKMLDLLVHASHCRSAQCQYPNCRKVKGLFRHGIQCKIRASGGCSLCKKMWYLLQLHARACKESQCHVPRCRDLKGHLRRLQQQSDTRRRAAVMEMMRQRAAEVASNTGL